MVSQMLTNHGNCNPLCHNLCRNIRGSTCKLQVYSHLGAKAKKLMCNDEMLKGNGFIISGQKIQTSHVQSVGHPVAGKLRWEINMQIKELDDQQCRHSQGNGAPQRKRNLDLNHLERRARGPLGKPKNRKTLLRILQ
uniref:Uncharacterized protein n=1 Tax=Romanomermis culicivorax TaxID=13658 RepID=A0A915KV76_ROMCU